jgi:hypothetical protein
MCPSGEPRVSKYLRSEDFVREARLRFDTLRTEGFRPRERSEYWVSYEDDDLVVDVMYDDRDGRVSTSFGPVVGDRRPHAGLSCLYVMSGLGAAQDIRDLARNASSLAAVLDSQRSALHRLLPVITGPDGPDLLLHCQGR